MARQSRHLLFLNQAFGFGGAETFNTQLLSQLQKMGWNVSAFTTHTAFADSLDTAHISVQTTPWPVDIVGDWKGLLKAIVTAPAATLHYWKILRAQPKNTVLLMSGFSEKILASPVASWLGIPIVWIEFGPVSSLFAKFGSLPEVLYNWASKYPQAVIVPSNCTWKNIAAETKIGSDRIQLIPCGTMAPKKHTRNTSPHPSILCVSRMERGKGQELLVQALPQILRKHPKARLRFIGTGDHSTVVSAEVARLQLEKHVDFLGFVPETSHYIAQASVCVFPSQWVLEGFGMVQIEAMSHGIPVVAFRTGPAVEIIDHGETGYLAKPGDVSDLAKQIIQVLDNPKKARSLGATGKKKFHTHYSIAAVAQQYNTVLEQARTQ